MASDLSKEEVANKFSYNATTPACPGSSPTINFVSHEQLMCF